MEQCYGTLEVKWWDSSAGLGIPVSSWPMISQDQHTPTWLNTALLLNSKAAATPLSNSNSFEVRALVNVVSKDVTSTTARNLTLIEKESGQSIRNLTPKLVRELVKIQDVPINQDWRFSLLKTLLSERKVVASQLCSTDMLDLVINSLCSS